jgi:hypothetical protein
MKYRCSNPECAFHWEASDFKSEAALQVLAMCPCGCAGEPVPNSTNNEEATYANHPQC